MIATARGNETTVNDPILRHGGNFSLNGSSGLLEVEPGRRVMLSLPPAPRGGILQLYSDFASPIPFLKLLPSVALDVVVSPTSRMKIVSQSHLLAFFNSTVDTGCHKVSLGREADLFVIPSKSSCGTCTWLILPNEMRDDDTALELHFLKLDLSLEDSVSVYRLTADPSRVAFLERGSRTTPVTFPFETGALVKVVTPSCDSIVQIAYTLRPKCKHVCGNQCLDPNWICNGIDECEDGKDELNCPTIPTTTSRRALSTASSARIATSTTQRERSISSNVTASFPSQDRSSSTSDGASRGATWTTQWERSTSSNVTASFPSQDRNIRTSDGALSLTHVSLYIAGAVILGACLPTLVYFCLLKRGWRRHSSKDKSDSRWTMMASNGNCQNADGISL